MLDAIKLALSSVALLASTTITGLTVTRSSLFGFAIQGPARVHVMELDEAAAVLSRIARLAAFAPVAPTPVPVSAPVEAPPPAPASEPPATARPADLLVAPRETLPERYSETWIDGPAARRRYDALRRALGAANVHKDTMRPPAGLSSTEAATVEIRWTARRGARVPAMEGQ
jgi:hypothetical protein